MHVIKIIARWVLLLAAISFAFPYRSEATEEIGWQSILLSIFMGLLALNMLLLVLRVRRRRVQLLFEFVLYPVFIGMLLLRLIGSNVFTSLTSAQLTLLGSPSLLGFFVVIYGVLIASSFIVLLDAKQAFQSTLQKKETNRKVADIGAPTK